MFMVISGIGTDINNTGIEIEAFKKSGHQYFTETRISFEIRK